MRKRKKSEDSGFNVWRSYSDMMAGVLLLFILIMCVTLFQAQKSYNESIKERDDKIALQEQYTAEILAQQSELDEKDSKLSSQDEQLDKQKKLLAELAAQLKEQQASLDEKTSLLATQQKKIDNIIGVKADVIEALQKEFSKNNVSVDIDAQTGALTLNANVLFDYDKSELTDEGKQELADILPIYCKVLLQKDYKKYLAEIIIDGYTDTDGDYDYNLELSQKRSLAVAQYLTEIRENFLSSDEISELQNYLTVNGHGSANPVLDSNGNTIVLPNNVNSGKAVVTTDGQVGYYNNAGAYVSMNRTIGLSQFNNPAGLEKAGSNLLRATNASGAALNEATNANLTRSKIHQSYLEGSNVQVADEMVNLIVAQRAYQLNSKAITTSDDMLEQANNLKR